MFRYLIAILPAAMMANTALTTTYTTTAPLNAAVTLTQTASQAALQASQIAQLAANLAQTASTTANNTLVANTLSQLPADYTTRTSQLKLLATALFNTAQTSALSPNVVRLAEATLRTTAALNSAAQTLNATQTSTASTTTIAQQLAQAAVETSTLAAQTARAIAESTTATQNTYATAYNSISNTMPAYTNTLAAANQAQIASMIAVRTIPSALSQAALSPSQLREVRQLVNSTIRTNPSIIVDTIANYNTTATSYDQAQALVRARSSEIFAENNQLVLGNPNGDVTIVEFNDYNCTYCKQMTATINRATQIDPNLRVLVKEAPVATATSPLAAKAAIAAQRQGQYASFRQLMATSNLPATPSTIAQTAQTLGLNQTAFNADLNNPALDRYLARNIELARSLGVQATPTIIVSKNNGQYSQTISGAVSLNQLQSLVAAVRNARTI